MVGKGATSVKLLDSLGRAVELCSVPVSGMGTVPALRLGVDGALPSRSRKDRLIVGRAQKFSGSLMRRKTRACGRSTLMTVVTQIGGR